MKHLARFLLCVTLTTATSSFAVAKTSLTISSWGGPGHGINTIVWPVWKGWVEEATEGRVTVDVVHDMGPPDSQMEMVADGVADVTWIYHGYNPGRFPLTKLPEFPTFQNFSSEAASAAYWRTYQKYLTHADEHRGLYTLAMGVHGPGQIFTTKVVNNIDDLDGLRLRAGGGVMSDIASAMNVTGVALPATGAYEAASQGVIDGAMMSLEGLRSFRVAEVAPYGYFVDGGFYRASFAIVMNPMVWDKVSAEDREAIEAVSGERLSRLFGYMMDVMDARGLEFAKELGNTFTQASEEDLTMLRKVSDDLIQDWAGKVSSDKLDAREALNYFRDQLAVAAEEETVASLVSDEVN